MTYPSSEYTRVTVASGKLKGIVGYVVSKDYYVLGKPMIMVFGIDGDTYVVQRKNIKVINTEVRTMKEMTRIVNLQITQITRNEDDVIDAFVQHAKDGAEGIAEIVKKQLNADDVLVTDVKVFVNDEVDE